MAGLQFLCGQIEAFTSSWNVDKDAVDATNLEARIAVGLSLYRCIRRADERWSDAVRGGAADDEGKTLRGLYGCWLTAMEQIADAVAKVEKQGIHIEESGNFHRSIRRVRLALSVDLAAIDAAYADLDAGNGIPIGEVADEIRRDHVAKRV